MGADRRGAVPSEDAEHGQHSPRGVSVGGGKNVTVQNCLMDGFIAAVATGGYLNGDGFGSELGTSVAYIDNVSANNADAGFDDKGTTTHLRSWARNNSRSFRTWISGDYDRPVSINARTRTGGWATTRPPRGRRRT